MLNRPVYGAQPYYNLYRPLYYPRRAFGYARFYRPAYYYPYYYGFY